MSWSLRMATSRRPIVEELHPALGNLIGRIEYIPLRGALVTNFRLIKAGAIHRANGGYLLLDARSVLLEPFSWAALKRTLRRGEIAIEDIGRFLGFTSTVSLEPDPIPLNVKVILFGDRLLYFLLAALDPELAEHFKVLADFENDIARTPENEAILARLLATLARRDGLKPLDREAVALVLEHAARSADHAGKLTLVVEQLREILIEADFCARDGNRSVISRADVDSALTGAHPARGAAARPNAGGHPRKSRADRHRGDACRPDQRSQRHRTRRIFVWAADPHHLPGAARQRERSSTSNAKSNSAGRFIPRASSSCPGFLAGRYALDTPMSLFASLVFEQSYGGVEGDSASSAELYALLSALADVPLRQDLAVTGSVNQHGEIQAIGGVNEKIEGFFDICQKRGLTGTQGVLIPQANVQHLMLRKDVIDGLCRGPLCGLSDRHDQ